MMQFFVLEIGGFDQYKFAWFEVDRQPVYSDAPRCEVCNRPVASRRWEPPHEVIIKQPRRIGDFVTGAGGCHFLVTELVLDLVTQKELTGFEAVFPIKVTKMGTTKASRKLKPPTLYGVYLERVAARLDYDAMNVEWGKQPDVDYCRSCGPGGGGKGGWWRSRERVVVDFSSWLGHDIFYAANGSGTIILSQRAVKLMQEAKLTNCLFVPAEKAFRSFGDSYRKPT